MRFVYLCYKMREIVCNDEDFKYQFNRIVYLENEKYHLAEIKNRKCDPMQVSGELIDTSDYLPKFNEDMTRCPSGFELLSSIYIKKPTFHSKNSFINEILALELIRQDMHPNIVTYYGCLVDENNLVYGIALQKCECTLKSYYDFNKELAINAMTDLRDAIRHLHSLNLIHCDIKPTNIMINNNYAILIDFDSCRKKHSAMIGKAGTDGWCLKSTTATEQNDWYSFNKILFHMKNNVQTRLHTTQTPLDCSFAVYET